MPLSHNSTANVTAWGVGNALFVAVGDAAPIAVADEKIASAKLVHNVVVSSDGKLVAALADKFIVVVEASSGTVLGTAKTNRRGTGLALCEAEGKPVVVTIDASAEMRAWPVPALDKNVFLAGHAMSVLSAVSVAPGNDAVACGDREGRIRISKFPVVPLMKGVCFLHQRYITSLAWLSTAATLPGAGPAIPPTLLLSTGADGLVALWDALSEPPQLLGSTSVAPHVTPGGVLPAVTVATTSAAAEASGEDEIAAVAAASGAKDQAFAAFDYVSTSISAWAVQGSTLALVVYAVPQLLLFALAPNPTGSGEAEPSAAADADAVTFTFTSRVVLQTPVASLTAAQGHFLVAGTDGSLTPVEAGSGTVGELPLAAALTAAAEAAGVDFAAAAQASEKVLPSPLDLAFAMGGKKSLAEAKAAVDATVASAAAAAEGASTA